MRNSNVNAGTRSTYDDLNAIRHRHLLCKAPEGPCRQKVSVPNGIKLQRIFLRGKGLLQFFARAFHEGVLFGTPFAYARFEAVGPIGVYD